MARAANSYIPTGAEDTCKILPRITTAPLLMSTSHLHFIIKRLTNFTAIQCAQRERRHTTFDQDISRKLVVVLSVEEMTTGDAEWGISGITGFVTLLDEHRRERVISSAEDTPRRDIFIRLSAR